MKKFVKNNIKLILGFILGAIIFGGIGTVVAVTLLASNISYTPSDTTWNVNNVKEAIDELYSKKKPLLISYIGKNSILGNTTMTYTFNEDVELGMIILSASNDISDPSWYITDIQSLSSGSYRLIDNSTISYSTCGHRVQIYIIENVKKDSVLEVATRYAGLVQVVKLY